MVMPILRLVVVFLMHYFCHGYNWTRINLPDGHVPFFFLNHPDIKTDCYTDNSCPFKAALELDKCWGYEEKCPNDQRLASPKCQDNDPKSRLKKDIQTDRFWREGDFGYIKGKITELTTLCEGEQEDDSSLACSGDAAYCYAKNIYIDMGNDKLARLEQTSWRYTKDFWLHGEIGGHCRLDKRKLEGKGGDTRQLSTWYGELAQFTELDFRPIDDNSCDIIFDKPVIFMKLDAGGNMYHHFCDFFNLYVSQHINGSSLTLDVQIIFWILHYPRYGDLFKETFDAFTEHKIDFLANYHGKRLCIKEAMFPVLARAPLGLFYGTPLPPGCSGSSLFTAFSEHLIHRLKVPSEGAKQNKIRITLLDRAAATRTVLNQNELYEALMSLPEYDVKLVVYKFRIMPFLEQVKISHNSDIFIGMHGAGLTHLLFQPDWGAVIELYNCEDIPCYRDLARLRGLEYLTWENDDKVYPHSEDPKAMPKSMNYTFDVDEFVRLVAMAANHVRSHPLFDTSIERELNDEL